MSSSKVVGRNFKKITFLLAGMFRHDDFPFQYLVKGRFDMDRLRADPLPCFNNPRNRPDIIIDATELRIEYPSDPHLQRATYSDYKHANTVKLLIGTNAAGKVVYVSDAYPGRISDRVLVEVTGILMLLESGAVIMADKGFLIEDICTQHEIKLVLPPLASSKRSFTQTELLVTRDVAAKRIHVERIIQRGKINKTLSDKIPMTLLPFIGEVAYNCFMLLHFSTPIVAKKE